MAAGAALPEVVAVVVGVATLLLAVVEHAQQHTHSWLGSPCCATAGAVVVRTTVVGGWDAGGGAGIVVEVCWSSRGGEMR